MISSPRIAFCLAVLGCRSVSAQSADTSLVHYRIRPSSIDSTVTRFDDPHYVVFARGVRPDAPLLVFMPGTGGQPQNASLFQDVAARQGYRVIGLQYVDADAIVQHCTTNPDPDCSEKFAANASTGKTRRT